MDNVLTKALSKIPQTDSPRVPSSRRRWPPRPEDTVPPVPHQQAPTQQAPVPPPPTSPVPPVAPADRTRSKNRWLVPAALSALASVAFAIVLWKPWAGESSSSVLESTTTVTVPPGGQQPSSSPRGPAVPRSDPDLGLGVPISRPPCDGTGIVMLDSATTPGRNGKTSLEHRPTTPAPPICAPTCRVRRCVNKATTATPSTRCTAPPARQRGVVRRCRRRWVWHLRAMARHHLRPRHPCRLP